MNNNEPKIQADLIICAKWLLTVVPNNQLLQQYAVVVQGGVIIDIISIANVFEQYVANEVITLNDHVLMPGLVNCHTHAAMSLMRGLADDLPLMPWLQDHIWPAEQAVVSPQFVFDGTLLACAEMLSGGITTFNDMYFYPKAAAQACIKAGMRANLGLLIFDFATAYASDANAYIKQGLDARDDLRDEPLLSFSFAPHAPYTVSDSAFTSVATLADQVNISIHTHVHETLQEIADSEKDYGLRPISRLANLGLLGPALTMAHCVHLNAEEIKLLAQHGCSIAHCPSSNLKLASGIAPIAEYIKQGINVSLGTDSAASNNRLDMFAEMRLAALLAKGQSGDATVVSAFQAIEMATINGAKALNMEDKIGSIEVGKLADVVAVNLSEFTMQPIFDVVSHLVYVAGRESVSHVWVNGDLTYHKPSQSHGVFSNVEPHELAEINSKWVEKLSAFKRNEG